MASILVVEDGDLFRDIIKEILELEGHHVSGAASGEEAVRLCQEFVLDLVITDIVMPGMNGLDLISFLRRFHPNLPILAFSGASETLLEEATARGATGALVKPFSSDDLLAMVDKILGKGMESKDDDPRTLIIICPNCKAVISYAAEGTIAYAGTCPNCKTAIPELRGAMIISFERPENGE